MRNFTFILILAVLNGDAQENISGVFNNEPIDPCGSESNLLVLNKKPMFGAYTREADVAWEKRIWRELDLREKINHPLYYPVDNQPCRISLIQLISKHVLKGDIIAFADESFYSPYTLNEVRKKLIQSEEIPIVEYDSLGNEVSKISLGMDSTSIFTKVIKVRFVEDWFLNKERSDVEVKIIGIAFYEYVEDKEAYKELFWVYFPQAKKYLAKYRVFNPKNISDHSTFDDLFQRREFGSYIVKETNVYDRFVFDYTKGVDALLESDRIKNDIFRFEHDLWHY